MAPQAPLWVLPYIDQPLVFWESVAQDYEGLIREVYFPLPGGRIGSGAPAQPDAHLLELLRHAPLPCAALVHPIILPRPVGTVAPPVIETLKRLHGDFGLSGATVTDLALATRIREVIPDLSLTASCLMQIARPNQVPLLEGIIDTVVPDTRIVRDLRALTVLKRRFPAYRLMVNVSCCPVVRSAQHFYEMGQRFPRRCRSAGGVGKEPVVASDGVGCCPASASLSGTYDELTRAGRGTLRDPKTCRAVLDAYAHRLPMLPRDIGGGPASVLEPIEISESFFASTLACDHQCHRCTLCRDYYVASSL
jgi:hypothetical protein